MISKWPTLPLSGISESITYGHTASAQEQGDGPKFLRITDIQNGKVNWSDVPYCECSTREESASRLRIGDILFARTGATTGKSFLIRECPERAVFASYLIRVRLSPAVNPTFLSHYFQTNDYWKQITQNVRGVAQPGVNATTLGTLRIPLPPMEEQRRIAAILDQAEALRAKRRQALAKLDTLTQSLFLEMFGDPATNPKGWPIGTIEDMVSSPKRDIRCGPFGTQLKVAEVVDRGVPLFGIETAVGNEFNPDVRKFVTPNKAKQLKAFEALPGDVLVTRMGTIGRACVVPVGFQEGRFSYHLFRVRPDRRKCIPEFLAATVSRSGIFLRQLQDAAHGAIMDGLSTQNLKMVKFPIPPTNLQEEFVRRIGFIDRMKSRMEETHLITLFGSLQHRAFRGEL